MKNTILVLLIINMTGCFSKEPQKTSHKGEILPKFTLLLADSSTYFSTASLPPGKPVVMLFFGPECPYSRAQMQRIIDNISEFKDIQFVVFTTAAFYQLKWFYEKYRLKEYQNIKTGLDYTNFFSHYFKAPGVPYLAIYGTDKRLKDVFAGQVPIQQIKNVAKQ